MTVAADRASVLRFNNGIFSSNTYVCLTSTPGKCFLIDPGLDAEGIDQFLAEHKLEPVAVFCTHGHFDHLGSASYFQKKYGSRLYLHADDVKTSKSANFMLMACKINHRVTVPTPDQLVRDGEEIRLGEDTIRYFHTPGHTPGSCFVSYRDAVFTGDTMYRNAIGLVSLPGENPEQLRESILKMWDTIPNESMIYPGHGGSDLFGKIKVGNLPLRKFLSLTEEVAQT